MAEIELDAINEQEEPPEKENPVVLKIEEAESNSKQNETAEIETPKEARATETELLEQLNRKMDLLLEAQQINV